MVEANTKKDVAKTEAKDVAKDSEENKKGGWADMVDDEDEGDKDL